MNSLDLTEATIAGTAEQIQCGKLSPVELTRKTLERIESLDHKIGAFTTEGIRTTYGYSSHQDYVPQRSAGSTPATATYAQSQECPQSYGNLLVYSHLGHLPRP